MKILVIDDELNMRRLIGDYLRNEGFEVIEGKDGFDGVDKIIQHQDTDLVLLDVRMPKMDGYETYVEIREISNVPVIFLTALDEVYHEVKGLKLGAYDYITKPFSYEVLIARVNNCLLKVREQTPAVIEINTLLINLSNREILIEGQNIGVTQKEFEVIALLVHNKSIVMDRGKILDRVWGYDYDGDPRTVDTHIKTLRAKMLHYGKLIKTVRGVGYYFEID
ncbi:response regulator transcription factor [Fusibacter bizertensis]|uniref:Stage 0 sporulation protein A homolog n=1 Tax=Fusibacter bizertensis TaxID=1488331 RepID=A0ABT6N9U7_9FIRM|nr:response regulator transcription factor [Fusibacter bizertensis]MDH8677190.1 response regulator transcription factor [Fusibacter bizertensis]